MVICLHTSYIVHLLKTLYRLVWHFPHKGGSVATLSDNGIEFKNKILYEAGDQLGIKRLFLNLFHLQGKARLENAHNFLKRTLTDFIDNSNLKWDELLLFACYCYNIFPGSDGTKNPVFLMFG